MKLITKITILVGLLMVSASSFAAKPIKVKVYQDAFVQGGETAAEPLGATLAERLRVQKSFGTDKYSRTTFLQFNLKKVEEINSVVLHICLKVYESKEDASYEFAMDVMGCDNNKWRETSITFENQPEIGDLLTTASFPKTENNEWVEITLPVEQVKELMDKKGKLTLVLYNSDMNRTSAEVMSKERKWSNGTMANQEAYLEIK